MRRHLAIQHIQPRRMSVCQICGDPILPGERAESCDRCSEALKTIEFCECESPDRKAMIVPDCDPHEPFYRCNKCGRFV